MTLTAALLLSIALPAPGGFAVFNPDELGIPYEEMKDDVKREVGPEKPDEKGRWRYRVLVAVNLRNDPTAKFSQKSDAIAEFWRENDYVQVFRNDAWEARAIIDRVNADLRTYVPWGDNGNLGPFRRVAREGGDRYRVKDAEMGCFIPEELSWRSAGMEYEGPGVEKLTAEVVFTDTRFPLFDHEREREFQLCDVEGMSVAGNWIFQGEERKYGYTKWVWKAGDMKYVEVQCFGETPRPVIEAFLRMHPSVHKEGETFDRVKWLKEEGDLQVRDLEERLDVEPNAAAGWDAWMMRRSWFGLYFYDQEVPNPGRSAVPPREERGREVERLKAWWKENRERIEWSPEVMKGYVKRRGAGKPDPWRLLRYERRFSGRPAPFLVDWDTEPQAPDDEPGAP